MSKTIRRLLLAGLTLTLVGSVFTPTFVQAATTDSSSAKASRSTSSVHYQFNAVQAPYNIVTDTSGKTTNVPWYQASKSQPDVQQIFSSADILNTDKNFEKNFIADSNGDSDASKVASRMTSLATNGIDGDPNQSLATAVAANSPLNISTTEFVTYESNLDYVYSWLFKAAAQSALSIRTQADIQTEYDKVITSKLKEIDTVGKNVGMASREGSFYYYVATFPGSAHDVLDNAGAMHLTETTAEQLAKLNPQASADQERAMLNQPLKNFIIPQDGSDSDNPTYLADGQLSSTAYPTCFVFGETKSTTPSVTSRPVTVHYVDEQGKTLKPDKTLTGSLGDTYKAEALPINGYKLVKTTGDETGKFTGTDQTVTYTYQKAAADAVVKDSVIYGLKKLNLYGSPTFAEKAVKATYAKKSRMNRPMFKVIGTATSKNGLKRYRVKDLNGKGTTGYVTANTGYVAPLYYATKHSKITVINPKGLNAYAKKNLTHKQAHYKQGQVLKVKKVVSHNLTTRFQLSNGKYVSADKNLVLAGEYSLPKRVQAKTGINRYNTANLTKKNRHIVKGTTLKITGWAYSNAHNFRKGDTLRYKVAGGYVTANSRLVDTIR